MKRISRQLFLFIFLLIFILIFKYSSLIKTSVISSLDLWLTSLVPSMLPMYLILDLLINYGITNLLYKIFRSNVPLLFIISLLAGTPSNAKYIREFYMEGLISKDSANLLLSFAYSPNPLFIIAMSYDLKSSLIILLYIYITDIIIYFIFHKKLHITCNTPKDFKTVPFIDCLTSSIYTASTTLTLILGVVVFFGIINTLLNVFNISSPFIASLLELTNALSIINNKNLSILWMLFASTFAGASIHVQIKSILEDTDLSYRYFFLGRLLASIPIIVAIIFK